MLHNSKSIAAADFSLPVLSVGVFPILILNIHITSKIPNTCAFDRFWLSTNCSTIWLIAYIACYLRSCIS